MTHVRRNAGWYTTGLIAAFLAISMIWWLWEWLRNLQHGFESPSTTIRNLGLFLAAPIALGLAVWRARVADRQAEAAQTQVAISRGSLRNERYQKGAEMLGSEALSVRLGGIYALARLAREHPEEYHAQIVRLLCSFVRYPPPEHSEVGNVEEHWRQENLRPDLQEIMREIGQRSDVQIKIDELLQEDYNRLDLRYAELPGVFLVGANLSGLNLSGSNLVGAVLVDAHLIAVDLSGADLTGADLGDSNLTGANFSGCNGLTQEQLDEAKGSDGNPPILSHTFDAKTGEQLVWRGKPFNE